MDTRTWTRICSGLLSLAFLLTLTAGIASAQVAPEKLRSVADKAFRHADLDIPALREQVGDLPAVAGNQARARLSRLGANLGSAHLDMRSGRPVTLLPEGIALVPGRGNSLTWGDVGLQAGAGDSARADAAREALMSYLGTHQADLGIDMAELSPDYRMASHGDGDLYQLYIPRKVGGIRVEGSFISATIGQGNLSLMTVNHWGDVRPSFGRRLTADEARDAAMSYLSPLGVEREWAKPELVYVPLANGRGASEVARGDGYRYELAWALRFEVTGDLGSWELYVDQRGNVLKNQDMNAYVEAKGGVLPVTNDGIDPDGVEQPGWPMPFMNVGSETTDTGGNYSATGSVTATFFGPFVNMADNCGTDSLTQSGGIDWGTSGGTDCTTPGFGGAGNTHASRSGFYEINRTKEMARSHLPSNSWLQARLTSNMNINNTCNAFWNGSTINFYRSGGGCANTGEIAAVFVHEWGHGMDANDVVGGIASPSGEGIADIYTALRLDTSCIGRNFLSSPCSGNGDPCKTCTGVRDIDYLERQSEQPHDYTWSNANCGGSVHCVGGVYSEAVWSLWKRKLSQLYGIDSNAAHEIVTRMTFIAAGNTSTWFSGGPPNGGCGGSSGYMNYLAADDDDGNLNNGTPHMTAIYQAFNDQEIACQTPTVQDSGCSGAPTAAPNVTATPGENQVSLSWGAVSGASNYEVFRAEGIFNCNFGKVKVAEVTGTSFTDTNLQNGRDYSYTVIAKGSSDACFSAASACDTVQPGVVPCSVDADCDDGTFCNGAETCNAGTCVAGSDPCPGGWSCDEGGDVCVPECTTDGDCDDGAFCNGAETCNVGAGTCNVGSDPCPGQGCDEGGDICVDTNGPQIAVYDAGLGAPACAVAGSSCDSTTLVDSRSASLSPAEPNQPNTLDGCADGTSGTYHNDESNDRIVISTLDGLNFEEGKTVEIAATVWAWSTNTSDTLDLFYAADANNPSWTLITSIVPPAAGANTLTAQYTLPAGGLQAVRAQFRYQSTNAPCSAGAYNDRDDLVFAVDVPVQCSVDADCDDGAFCNGAETCNAGVCQAGTPPACDDGAFCNGTETCNESTDSCDAGTAPACDDGLFCNGTETCNEGTDSCDAGTAPACGDGLFCNGTETCNEGTDSCDAGTAPNCNDGVGCTDDSCNESTDSCDNVANNANCPDDGAFCNGSEFCDATLDCQSTGNPCSGGQTCNESTDVCEDPPPGGCSHSADFEAGAGGWTQGADTCTTGSFIVGTPDATAWQVGSGNPGQAFFTQNNPGGIGTDDVDGGTCEALSPVVDCAGSAAALVSLDYYHGQRDAGDDASDGFTIEVLNNGSVVATMVSIGDVTNSAAWTNVQASVASPGDIQIRVRATDAAGAGDIVEGGIDNVSVTPTTPPSCVVDDDFEGGAPGWVNDPASTCTTGDYVTGNPTNPSGGYQIVGSHSGVTSIFTATNTSAGVNDVDGGNCILGSPSWTVPSASTLSVWYWFGQRDAGDDASGDFNILEYSTNGGATWNTLASNGDSTSNPVWTEATASIPAGSTVQLRMQCSDGAGPGDLIECGLDDVSICD